MDTSVAFDPSRNCLLVIYTAFTRRQETVVWLRTI